jgi:Xaa-Pro aminopeptidase
MDIKDFLNHTAAGNAVKAQEILDDILSNKAFEALDEKKTQIAKTLYATEDEVEVQDTADTPVEDEELLTQEEVEELDELSKETLGRYVQKRVKQIPNIEVNYQMTPDEDGPMGAKRIRKFQKKINKGVTGALNRLSGTDVTKKPAKTKTNEEIEQIDELSNETLKSYAGKVVDKTRTMPQGAKKQKHLAGFGKVMDKMQDRLHKDLDRMP